MGVLDACGWAMAGRNDIFDRCADLLREVKGYAEEQPDSVELHGNEPWQVAYGVQRHVVDVKGKTLAEIDSWIEKLRECDAFVMRVVEWLD